ncbi:hypothetical protein LTR59_007370 [Friedmanniomyces endolithicus]|nr:hypothetical protein LTR94_021793 [Friedmanniomyces endolithicus]KAK0771458.1 hypothetical protein LTR38_017208 [Friedmanniomyces endolithicus]KAK0795551.1 hypothetical protein LTR59_007370 [Friedmanniomyces endolithicus]KAK0808086.1 hypothetical protein LTR75_006363 [Friedmanniomyces endolithicus]KAK0826604.1 hypothetical protein LTR03_017119 [Friedmanniomyces endolithicus]
MDPYLAAAYRDAAADASSRNLAWIAARKTGTKIARAAAKSTAAATTAEKVVPAADMTAANMTLSDFFAKIPELLIAAIKWPFRYIYRELILPILIAIYWVLVVLLWLSILFALLILLLNGQGIWQCTRERCDDLRARYDDFALNNEVLLNLEHGYASFRRAMYDRYLSLRFNPTGDAIVRFHYEITSLPDTLARMFRRFLENHLGKLILAVVAVVWILHATRASAPVPEPVHYYSEAWLQAQDWRASESDSSQAARVTPYDQWIKGIGSDSDVVISVSPVSSTVSSVSTGSAEQAESTPWWRGSARPQTVTSTRTLLFTQTSTETETETVTTEVTKREWGPGPPRTVTTVLTTRETVLEPQQTVTEMHTKRETVWEPLRIATVTMWGTENASAPSRAEEIADFWAPPSGGQTVLDKDEMKWCRDCQHVVEVTTIMFAPPPLQFSQADIARFKAEALARLQEKRDSAETTGSDGRGSKVSSPASSTKTSRRTGLFSRSSKIKVSSPIAQDAQQPPVDDEVRKESLEKETRVSKESSPGPPPPVPFAAGPRKAPRPPKRPARPEGDAVLAFRSAAPLLQPAQAPVPSHSPPPVPQKSTSRTGSGARQSRGVQAERPRSVLDDASLNTALAQLKVGDEAGAKAGEVAAAGSWLFDAEGSSQATRRASSSQTPTRTKRRSFHGDLAREAPADVEKKRLSGVQSGKIDKAPRKRSSAAATLEATLFELNYPGLSRRATEPARNNMEASPAGDEHSTSKRRQHGETLSMLLDAGFFPGEDVTVYSKKNPNISIHVRLPLPLSLVDKDLPDTPTSITSTPTELYHSTPRRALPSLPKTRRPRRQKRSPLAQIAATDTTSNSGSRSTGGSPDRLSSIPELANVSESSPPPSSSGTTTPVATMIHLRGGSIVTVTPPELTAWQKQAYIQGPIKLPTPAILPRKNSVASLEPFQEAIDRVYQHALVVPRRRSDDAVVEDICEWVDEFGFEDVSYQGDTLMIDESTVDEVQELGEEGGHDIERFSTPPLEPVASPLEKAVAKEVVAMSKLDPAPRLIMPPVENEETLRARGIARLTQHSTASSSVRKESLTLARQEPEHSMLATSTAASTLPEAERKGSSTRNPLVDQGGFDWDDDVEEMDGQPAWDARKKHGLHRGVARETRNPVVKMRRFMATASAVL